MGGRSLHGFSKLLWRHVFVLLKQFDKIAGGTKATGNSKVCNGSCGRDQKLFGFCKPDAGHVFPEFHVKNLMKASGKIAVAHTTQPGSFQGGDRGVKLFPYIGKGRSQLSCQLFIYKGLGRKGNSFFMPVAENPEKNTSNMVADSQFAAIFFFTVFPENFLNPERNASIF